MNEEYVVDNVEANEKLEAEIVQEENQQDKKPITEYAFNNKIEKIPDNKQKVIAIVGIVCGCIILVFGIIAFSGVLYTSYGTAGSTEVTDTCYEWYGGDAYTGIQQAAADASTNAGIAASNIVITNIILNRMIDAMSKIMGLFLISIGLITICRFLYKWTGIKSQENQAVKNY